MKCCVWNTKSSEWVFSEMFWEGSSSPLWPRLTITRFVWIWNFLVTSISCWRCYWKFGWSVASWTHLKNIVEKFSVWTFQNTKQNVLTLSELGERAMWSWRQFFKSHQKSWHHTSISPLDLYLNFRSGLFSCRKLSQDANVNVRSNQQFQNVMFSGSLGLQS